MAKDKKDQEETKKEKDQDKKPVRGPFHDWTEEDARF